MSAALFYVSVIAGAAGLLLLVAFTRLNPMPGLAMTARTLLLLARYGKHDKPVRAVPPISQETLAEMVGTTRSRVNFFMKKFQRLGFIDYTNGLKVNNSLLTVVLHD